MTACYSHFIVSTKALTSHTLCHLRQEEVLSVQGKLLYCEGLVSPLLSCRDFVTVRYWEYKSGVYYSVGKAVSHDLMPSKSGKIRSVIIYGRVVIV